jgi:hypothetical protein
MKKASIVSLLLLVALLVTAFVPNGAALAADKGIGVPTLVEPEGVILDRTPTFVWEKVTGATYYRLELWYELGTAPFYSIEKNTSICDATYCDFTLTKTLDYRDYYWRVKAKGSSWGDWSEKVKFIVSSPNFNSNFNYSLTGWERVNDDGGLWFKRATLAYTTGKAETWANLGRYANGGKYNDFDYTAVLRRIGGTSSGQYPANCLSVRMGAYTSSGKYLWYPGYRFCVTNGGKWAVWYQDIDSSTIKIFGWTANANVHTSGWNTLRVVAVGPDFEFYVNGALIKSFTDESKDRGYVGISGWKFLGTSTEFQVDNAKLTVITSAVDLAARDSAAPVSKVPAEASYFYGSD